MKTISFQTDILPLKNELFRLALRITQNRFEAEDVVQETMLKVWKGRSEWDKIEKLGNPFGQNLGELKMYTLAVTRPSGG